MSPKCSQIVTTSSVHRSLLVTSISSHESDFLAALRKANSQRPDLHFELTYLDLSPTLDFIAILFSLDRPRSGHFTVVYMAPRVSTCSSLFKSWATATQIQAAPIGFS